MTAVGGQPVLGLVFTTLGYLTGVGVFLWAARRLRPHGDPRLRWVLLIGLTGGILGAKLTQWLALGWPLQQSAAILSLHLGGRTILGGVIAGWLCVESAKYFLKLKYSTGAAFALALPAGEAIGRLGCWFNGCCYGCAVDQGSLPWAVYQHEAWRHPAQLYSALAAALIFALLLWLFSRPAGQGLPRLADLFYLYLLLFGLSRLGLEFLRERDHLYYGLSLAQWVSLELAAGGALVLAVSFLRQRRQPNRV